MRISLVGALLATTMVLSVPASAQRLSFGPDGPRVDLRSRGERMRDRDYARRGRDGYYREERYRDRDRGFRRGYEY